MNLATVIGYATATVKHESLNRWRLLVVQPLGVANSRDGVPILAIDELGSQVGQEVMITSDGKAVSEAMNCKNTPVRWMVLGQVD